MDAVPLTEAVEPGPDPDPELPEFPELEPHPASRSNPAKVDAKNIVERKR
jgi:hypothetical protein